MKDFACYQSFTTTWWFRFIGGKCSFVKRSHTAVSTHKFRFAFAIFHCAVPLAHTRQAQGSTTVPVLSSEQHLAGERESTPCYRWSCACPKHPSFLFTFTLEAKSGKNPRHINTFIKVVLNLPKFSFWFRAFALEKKKIPGIIKLTINIFRSAIYSCFFPINCAYQENRTVTHWTRL